MEFEQRRIFHRKADDDVKLIYFHDYCIYTVMSDEAVGRHVAAGVYDIHIEAVIRRVLRSGMGFLDLGANIGVFTLLAAALVGPTGYVLAVEPNPDNVKLLEASRQKNNFEHVQILQAAAGSKIEVLALHCFGTNGTATTADTDSLLTARTVASLPISRLLARDQPIDLIKVDVEGAEFRALSGLSDVISAYKPVIISEFSPGQIKMVSRVTSADYLRFLQAFGYNFGHIGRDGKYEIGLSIDEIHDAHASSGVDHIDIIAIV